MALQQRQDTDRNLNDEEEMTVSDEESKETYPPRGEQDKFSDAGKEAARRRTAICGGIACGTESMSATELMSSAMFASRLRDDVMHFVLAPCTDAWRRLVGALEASFQLNIRTRVCSHNRDIQS